MNNKIILTPSEAVAKIQKGLLVAYPTETFFALGCDALNPSAVNKVYAVKKRNKALPLPVIINDKESLARVASDISKIEEELMRVFWPGPLTIILEANRSVPVMLTAGAGTIAVRWSSHPVACALCQGVGGPLVSSSANTSGFPPVTLPENIEPALLPAIAGVVADGPEPCGDEPSTIVKVDGVSIRVLRKGKVSNDALEQAGFTLV